MYCEFILRGRMTHDSWLDEREPGTKFGILCCQIYPVTKDQDNVTRAGAIQAAFRYVAVIVYCCFH